MDNSICTIFKLGDNFKEDDESNVLIVDVPEITLHLDGLLFCKSVNRVVLRRLWFDDDKRTCIFVELYSGHNNICTKITYHDIAIIIDRNKDEKITDITIREAKNYDYKEDDSNEKDRSLCG